MFSHNRNDSPGPIQPLRFLCTEHLKHEASVLEATLVLVRSMDAAFRQRSRDAFASTVTRHADVGVLIEGLQSRRKDFRASAARLLGIAPDAITVPVVLDRLPEQDRSTLATEVTRLRVTAAELAEINRRISIFLRVHLNAYQGILRNLTSSHRGSGRYGRTGNAESHDYRPLLQIHG